MINTNMMILKMKGVNRSNIISSLLDKELTIIGYSLLEAAFEPNWRNLWKIDKDQLEYFKKESLPIIKGVFHCSKKKAEFILDSFIEMYGLKLKN